MNKWKRVMALAAALVVGTQAMARETPLAEVRFARETVRYDDLDVNRSAGTAMLHWRLRVAADRVCRKAEQRLYACRTQALQRALATVPASVSSYHAQWMASGTRWFEKPQPGVRRVAASR